MHECMVSQAPRGVLQEGEALPDFLLYTLVYGSVLQIHSHLDSHFLLLR